MAIFGYILGNCKKSRCICCSSIVYNDAKTAVLKLSVIKQLGLAVAAVVVPGTIIVAVAAVAVAVGVYSKLSLTNDINFILNDNIQFLPIRIRI